MYPESEPDFKDILENLPTGLYVVDRARRITLWSEGATRITGYLEQEVLGQRCQDNLLLHCNANNEILCGSGCPLAATMHDGQLRVADVLVLHRDGYRVPVRVRAAPVRNGEGAIVGAVECFDERPVLIGAPPIEQAPAIHPVDIQTGLPTPAAMAGHLKLSLEDFVASGVPFGVLEFAVDDLDRVRRVDGQKAAAAILYATGQTLAKNAEASGVAGLWGEQRFVVALRACGAAALAEFGRALQRAAARESVPWWGDRLSVGLSAGGTVARPGDTYETLAERVEGALEQAIRNGDGELLVV
jgi:PAS domain S-box-containing protein